MIETNKSDSKPKYFPHDPLAKQVDVGKVPQFFSGWGEGPLKVGEILLTKLRPGWRQVLSSSTVQMCLVVKMICT